MRTGSVFTILALLVFLCVGCIPCRLQIDEQVRPLTRTKLLKDCVLLVSNFEHPTYEKVRGSSLVVGWTGEDYVVGTEATQHTVRGTAYGAPMWLIYALQDSGAFKGVVTAGTDYDFILTGRLSSESWHHWSCWLQLIDLWVHAWIFPTLPYCGEAVCELRLTDRSGQVVMNICTKASRTYIATVWGGLYLGGGGYPIQRELEKEALNRALAILTRR